MALEFHEFGTNDCFGFFESREGREFLRSVLPIFQEETGMGDKKLAAVLVAENKHKHKHPGKENFSSEDDESESAALAVALNRWQKGHVELWTTKPEKSRHYLMLLEKQMMTASTSRSIIKGKAEALLTHQARSGAAAFFYGANSTLSSLDAIYRAQLDVAGTYQCLIQEIAIEQDEFMGLKETQEEWHPRPVFHLFIPKEGAPYMEAHEFTLIMGDTRRVRHQRYGYAFPTFSGVIHRLMVGVDDRRVRSHDVLRHHTDIGHPMESSGDIYKEGFSIIRHYVGIEPARSDMPAGAIKSSFDKIVAEFLVAVDDEMKSNIERVRANLATEIIF